MRLFLSILTLLCIVSITQRVAAQDRTRLAVLPFEAPDLDARTANTLMTLLINDLEQAGTLTIIPPRAVPGGGCGLKTCAAALGRDANATHALALNLLTLGDKWIVQYLVVNVITEDVTLTDRVDAPSLENMDEVMGRIAASVLQNRSMAATLRSDNILESEVEPNRLRRGNAFGGFTYGLVRSFDEDTCRNDDRIDLCDFYDPPNIMIAYRRGLELNDGFAGIEFGFRGGFMTNLFGAYLLSRTDISPYIGGGLGFRWPNERFEDEPRGAIDMQISAGMMLFRTYRFRLYVQGAIAKTLQSDEPAMGVITIGYLR